MGVDYDLVIIGGSLAAREAALMAVRSRANVALVEPPSLNLFVGFAGLAEVARQAHTCSHLQFLGLQRQSLESNQTDVETCIGEFNLDWSEVNRWVNAVETRLRNQFDGVYLAGQGIDYIFEGGEFTGGSQLVFATQRRKLTARRYLLATGSRPWIPNIEGLKSTGFVTIDNWLEVLSRDEPPQSWVILGETPQGLEIAQILAKLGCQVSLITLRSHIWQHASLEAIQLLQAQLEADGVEIICDTKVNLTRAIAGKKWLQVGDKAIECDEILVAIAQQPRLEGLNLAAVDVKWRTNRLIVNDYLQTTNSRIYACGDILGGYPFLGTASYEAQIAVHNSLFIRKKRINYQQIPYNIYTQPNLAQIGLTFTQAQGKYSHLVMEVKEYFKNLNIAQVSSSLTGLCSLVIASNGQILGASILGDSGGELINIIALAMQQNLHIRELAKLAVVAPSYSQIITRIAQKWHEQKLNQNFFSQEFLDDFFQIRRHFNL